MNLLSNFFNRKNHKTDHPEISVDPRWSEIVDKAIGDYKSLTENEKTWFNIRVLLDAFNNGGLISYYYNSGAENVYDAIEAFEKLGMSEIAVIIKKYNNLLCPNSSVPKDIDERNEYVNNLDEETDSLMVDLESDFQNQIDSIETKLKIFLFDVKI